MNFQLFLYMLSESFMKTKFKKNPWSTIVSSLQCLVLGVHENYHLIPYTSTNLYLLLLTQFLNNAWMCFVFFPLIILTGKPDCGVTV